MFTGIIQATGSIVKTKKINRGRRITIKIDQKIARGVPEGGSVAIDGVCLTAIHSSAAFHVPPKRGIKPRATTNALTFELMDSTLALTTLGALCVGDRVNIEPAMHASDLVGGHFVSGHADGVGRVKSVRMRERTRYVVCAAPQHLMRYVVPQGSITVNGVSLTVVDVEKDSFSVALTSYTATHTNLGALKVGNRANIETDMFAKYILNFLNHYGSYQKIPHRRGKV